MDEDEPHFNPTDEERRGFAFQAAKEIILEFNETKGEKFKPEDILPLAAKIEAYLKGETAH